MIKESRKNIVVIFCFALLAVILIFTWGVLKTNAYNNALHQKVFFGASLFGTEDLKPEAVSVKAAPRGSTWTKAFDLYDEGITEHNYQAYTYDFSVKNNTKDDVCDFDFKLTFNKTVFLLSAWNGALEIHQNRDGGEIVATVPDLREFNAELYPLDTITFDGETLIRMEPGDYLKYIPSSDISAMEVPIKPYEGTVPGIILYAPIGEDISDSSLELEYRFHRLLKREPRIWISVAGLMCWIIALLIYVITSSQIKKYKERHERDNVIIRESIETFTYFIDAKDPYTNGHSKRVADYTKLIAKEMGFEGEELDRVYYIALLHDCGKIGVPDNILCKPERLTDEEFEVIKSHTERGAEILSSFKSLKDVGLGAYCHHERYDGSGYPEGKSGEDIPLIARMICVADSFDAMNSNRVYRKKLSTEDIINEIEKNKGKQFDPQIADIFLKLIKEKKI
ncbi:MAG: HD-GYP domain-containing protein [Lachnospiraceae bacterium]|nr:HD-GYP domain-containing protein [Lachnospiraceae bacterium]